MSSVLVQIIEGALLGDANIRIQTISKKNISISDYKKAIDTILHLQNSSNLELSAAVEKFNEATTLIISAPTAKLRFHKALLEEQWIQYLSELLNTFGYPSRVPPPKKTAYLWGRPTIQMYYLYKRWYVDKKKHVPSNLSTPLVLLLWFTGDGGTGKYCIQLHTQSFNYSENNALSNLLKEKIGIRAKIYDDITPKGSKCYYLNITHQNNISKFFEYLELTRPKSILQ